MYSKNALQMVLVKYDASMHRVCPLAGTDWTGGTPGVFPVAYTTNLVFVGRQAVTS